MGSVHGSGHGGTGGVEAEAEPPHRLRNFRGYLVGSQVTDARVAAPPTQSSGVVPAVAAEAAATRFGELGLAEGRAGWRRAGAGRLGYHTGWADLDRAEPLRPGHRFPAFGVTRLITVATALRLAAENRIGLDDDANDHMRGVRLADGIATNHRDEQEMVVLCPRILQAAQVSGPVPLDRPDAKEHPARPRSRSAGRHLAGRPVSHFFPSRPD